MKNESTQECDLTALVKLAARCRANVTATLGPQRVSDDAIAEDLGAEAAGFPTITQILADYEELRQYRDELIRSCAVRTRDLFRLQSGNTLEGTVVESVTVEEAVLTPPDAFTPVVGRGSGTGVEKEFQERLAIVQMLLLDLDADPADPEKVQITIGSLRPDMMRDLTYASIFVPKLKRLIEVCNEVGNRSFIWNTDDPQDVMRFGQMTKQEKYSYLVTNPSRGSDLIMQLGWEERMRKLLIGKNILVQRPGTLIVEMILAEKEKNTAQERWNARLRELQELRTQHPDQWPEHGTTLGNWLWQQRKKMRDGELSEKQKNTLLSFGMMPAESRENIAKRFEKRMSELQEFRRANPGIWPTQQTKIGRWLGQKRQELRDGKVTEAQQISLATMGVEPAKKSRTFNENLEDLREFRSQNPTNWPLQIIPLGVWLTVQKMKMRDGKLTEEQKKNLEALGVVGARRKEEIVSTFETWLIELQEFRREHPTEWPSIQTPMGRLLQKNREKMRDGKLSDERRKALENLGVAPAKTRESAIIHTFNNWCAELQKFQKLFPGKHPKDGTPLRRWISVQKKRMRDGMLSEEERTALEGLGVQPAARKEDVTKTFDDWIAELKELSPGQQPKIETPLGIWLSKQRQKMRAGNLNNEQRIVLQGLGVEAAHKQKTFDEQYNELVRFNTEFPDQKPRSTSALGKWLQRKRVEMRDGKLNTGQRELLASLGIEPAAKGMSAQKTTFDQ